MRNRRSVRIMPCLSQAFGPTALLVAFDAFGNLLFSIEKKGSKKCRSQTPRGALHSAKRFCNITPCAGLPSGLHHGCGLRDGLARCA